MKDYDPFASLAFDKEKARADHRKSRKSRRKTKGKVYSGPIGKNATAFAKRMLHRYNRRTWEQETPYYKNEWSLNSVVWSLT